MKNLPGKKNRQAQLFKIRALKDHVIICGLGRKGLLLAEGFINEGNQVVVIELDEGNDLISRCREKGAIVMIGDAADEDLLKQSGIKQASYIISVCGDDKTNAKVAVKSRALVEKNRNRILNCIIHIINPRLFRLLLERELEMSADKAFRLEFFNIFDLGARACLSNFPPFDLSGLVNGCLPHLLIVGLGRLGENLLVQAAGNWNEGSPELGQKLDITILDREAEDKIKSLQTEYPLLNKICRLHPVKMEINPSAFQTADFFLMPDKNCRFTSVYICLGHDSFGLAIALDLNHKLKQHSVPLIVCMAHQPDLGILLEESKIQNKDLAELHFFGWLDRTCIPGIIKNGTNEILAQTIHEEYVRKQHQQGKTSQTNPAMVSWHLLPEALKESNRSQAGRVRDKLKHLGCGIAPLMTWGSPDLKFTPDEIERAARREHQYWMEERRSHGWKYSLNPKDIQEKTTPYLVPWDELSEEIKELDRDTVRNLPVLLARAGFQIYRRKNPRKEEVYKDA
ncbi:MAG: NAD-binding protein [Candidatus Aminicenantes bacterium]|nr:NAD-binding protein [Candidatus Aminicenantes bacterium]